MEFCIVWADSWYVAKDTIIEYGSHLLDTLASSTHVHTACWSMELYSFYLNALAVETPPVISNVRAQLLADAGMDGFSFL